MSKKMKSIRRKLAVLLTVCLTVAMLPLTGFAAAAKTVTVTGFAELPEEIAEQSVITGTSVKDLTLPDSLEAWGYASSSNADAASSSDSRGDTSPEPGKITISGVKWECDKEPFAEEEDTYTFKAKLPKNYTLAEDTGLPEIVVEVSNDADDGMVLDPNISLLGAMPKTMDGYSYDAESKTLTITSNDGTTAWKKDTNITASEITTVVITNGVTAIGYDAFSGCEKLTKVTISDSVTMIGSSAFYQCWKLEEVTIPDSVTTIGSNVFQHCQKLQEITIPASVKTINAYAFAACGLLKITFERSSTKDLYIDDSAFEDSHKGGSIDDPNGVVTVPEGTLDTYKTILKKKGFTFNASTGWTWTIKEAGSDKPIETNDYSFDPQTGKLTIKTNGGTANGTGWKSSSPKIYAAKIKEVEISDGVTEISQNAFDGCEKLERVVTSDSLAAIPDTAFYECTALKEVTLGNHVSYIGSSAFSGCTSLESIVIPAGVSNIGGGAFYGCTQFSAIEFKGKQPPSFSSNTFPTFSADKKLSITVPAGTEDAYTNYLNITTLKGNFNLEEAPSSVIADPDGNYSFDTETKELTLSTANGCLTWHSSSTGIKQENVTSAVIKNLDRIEKETFKNCINLKEVDIPDNLRDISYSAFENCTSLETINVPESCMVYASAFAGCTALKSFKMPSAQWTVPLQLLKGCTSLTDFTMSDSVTEIGNEALADCSSLTELKFSSRLETIGSKAFRGCSALAAITFQNKDVPTISEDSFVGLPAKGLITVPAGTMESYQKMLEGCGFTFDADHWKITESESVLVTGDGYTFNPGTGMLKVTSDAGTAAWEEERKVNAADVKSIVVMEEVTKLAPHGGGSTGAFSSCKNAIDVTISGKVKEIGTYAFMDCEKLEVVVINARVEAVGDSAFSRCTSLKGIVLPYEVVSVGENAFTDCTSLKEVAFAGNVETIKRAAFWGCTSLSFLEFDGKTPPVMDRTSFNQVPSSGRVTALNGDADAYKTALGNAGLNVYSEPLWTINGSGGGGGGDTSYIWITFDANGGSVSVRGADAGANGKLSSLPTPVRSGYTFDGWYTRAAGGTRVTTNTVFSGSTVIYAHWRSANTGSDPGTGSGSGGSSNSGGSFNYVDSLPQNYQGGTRIIGHVRVPEYVSEGTWSQTEEGGWRLSGTAGTVYTATWVAAYNPYADVTAGQPAFDWFRFDENGDMVTGWYTDGAGDTYYLKTVSDNTKGSMAVGWLLIDGNYYYFNEEPDGSRGKLLRNTTTPDGHVVDKNGVRIR